VRTHISEATVRVRRDERVLSYKELADVDALYSRAKTVADEARTQLRSFNYDLAVRRGQEAVELYIKSAFRFTGTEYPRSHDVGNAIYEVCQLLAQYGVTREAVARMILANSTMGLWRAPSFYGDERLNVAKVFSDKEAEIAIRYAEEVRTVCDKVRNQLYQRAASATK